MEVMKFYLALILNLLSGDRVDYLPSVRRPWLVNLGRRQVQGRGKTLCGAARHYLSFYRLTPPPASDTIRQGELPE